AWRPAPNAQRPTPNARSPKPEARSLRPGTWHLAPGSQHAAPHAARHARLATRRPQFDCSHALRQAALPEFGSRRHGSLLPPAGLFHVERSHFDPLVPRPEFVPLRGRIPGRKLLLLWALLARHARVSVPRCSGQA